MWEAASIDELELNGMRLSTHVHVCCSEKGISKAAATLGIFLQRSATETLCMTSIAAAS